MARSLLLDVFNKEVKEVNCETLDDYYKYLQCDCFDIARRFIGDKMYDIFCDDIGLFKDDIMVSAVDKFGEPMLVGNLIFCLNDGYGNEADLQDEDIKNISDRIKFAWSQNHPEGYPCLIGCECDI